jgi:hypothetical protein
MIFGMRKTLRMKALVSQEKGRGQNGAPLFPVKPDAGVIPMALGQPLAGRNAVTV